MKTRSIRSVCSILMLVLPASLAAAQTSFAGSAYGAFSGTTTSTFVQQTPSNSAGVLFELRHIANPVLGFEATYSYNRDDQTYTLRNIPTCGLPCSLPPSFVPVNAHEITADWIPSLHIGKLRPFGVIGAGVLFAVPGTSASGTHSSTQPVYVYGAGVDWGLLPHLGLRFQYRGNFYSAPSVLTTGFSSTGAFTHTAEPMIGAYFNF
jgi:opacity protein-like surface antigen